MDWIKFIENILYYFLSFILGIAVISSIAIMGIMLIANLTKGF